MIVPAVRARASGKRTSARIALAAAACALLLGAAALADHTWKTHRMRQADVQTWYCANRGIRCDEPQTTDIEASWQQRELLYRGGFGLAAFTALAAAAMLAASRSRRT
jgi:hypothetical protein